MTEIDRFKATKDGGLSAAMRTSWQKNGFLHIEGFASSQECQRLMEQADDIIDAFDPADLGSIFETEWQTHSSDDYFRSSGDKMRLFFEDGALDDQGGFLVPRHEAVNKIGHAMHDLDPVFCAFSRKPQLARLASDLGQADPGLIQSMYIYKPPRIGGEVHCHQDSTFLYTTPQSCIGFWFALEDATLGNGCLQAIPGAHEAPLTRRFCYRDNDLKFVDLNEAEWDQADAVPLEAPQGSLIVLHGHLPHFSGPNTSHKARRAYTLHTVDRTTTWAADNWLKRDAAMPLRGFAETDALTAN